MKKINGSGILSNILLAVFKIKVNVTGEIQAEIPEAIYNLPDISTGSEFLFEKPERRQIK